MFTGQRKQLANEVARLIHRDQFRDAAQLVSDELSLGLKIDSDSPKIVLPPLQHFLHYCLNNGGMEEAAALLWTPTQFNPSSQSVKDIWRFFDETTTGLIMGAASMGKCLGISDLCRMADGSVKAAGEVINGDLLAGDDGNPRTVLSTTRGWGELYKIDFGEDIPAFDCNADHVLTLICAWSRKNNRGKKNSSTYTRGKMVEVTVANYITWSKQRRRAYKMFLSPVEFPAREQKVDPYVYGAWLGDGTCCRCELTSPDGPMIRTWVDYWIKQGFKVEPRKHSPITWYVHSANRGETIWPNEWVRRSMVNGEKRIMPEYLGGSIEQRRAVLSGVIDADGTCAGAGFDIVTKWAAFADDLAKLARSLGFVVHRHSRKHSIKSRNFSAVYHHVVIRGPCSDLPTKEKASNRKSNRQIINGKFAVPFKIRPKGVGEYAGFSVDGNHRFVLESGIVTHNSYSMGVRLFLEWLRDPEWTSIKVIGPSEDHLEANLFSHLVGLHQQAKLPMPGTVGELYIGLDRRNLLSSIKGVVIPVGKVKKAGRLQGGKRKSRPNEHPIFGTLTRLFLFIDEIENVPGGIWGDVDNILSNVQEEGISDGFKVFAAYNPTNQGDEVAKRAEPPFGWNSFDKDLHFRWKSVRDWDVLRLDGEKSENVVQGKIVYPGLQTRAGLAKIAKNAGGLNTAGYYSMGRGAYPPMGIELTVIPPGLIPKAIGEFIWLDTPRPIGSTDLALEGGAAASYTLGSWGKATGMKLPPSLEYPNGRTVMFKNERGQVIPRWGLQATKQFTVPKGDTVVMKNQLIDLNKKTGVRPEYYALDRTGNGRGVSDLMKHEWGQGIHAVNYSQGPSKTKIMEEDSTTCDEEYPRMDSELWFALQKFLEFGHLLIHPQIDMSKLTMQLTQRKYATGSGAKTKVEPKRDYMSRGYESPDEADSLALFVHAARMGSGIVLSMKGGEHDSSEDDDRWYDGEADQKIDFTNRPDMLEETIL